MQYFLVSGFSQQFVVSLLYHDGRRCILSALKLLLTARIGVTWTLDLDDRITELVQKYTDQLIEDGELYYLLVINICDEEFLSKIFCCGLRMLMYGKNYGNLTNCSLIKI